MLVGQIAVVSSEEIEASSAIPDTTNSNHPLTKKPKFSDVADNPYQTNILRLAEIGIVNGYEDGTFRPLNSINRAELLKMVFEFLDQDIENYPGNCFKDVKEQWFAPYVCRAKDLGIVNGYDDGYFRPEKQANMVEAMKIIINAFDLPVDQLQDGESWYLPYMEFVHRNNLLSKYSYLPGRDARRGEIAYLVDEMIEIQREETYVDAKRHTASFGCGQAAPGTIPTQFTVDGAQRSAIVVIPEGYDPNEQVSLVFAFHGRTNSNERVRSYYGIEKTDFGKAIFVYPAGIQSGSGYSWSDGGDAPSELRDYEFFDVMVDEITSNYCVNMDQIYAVGHSLGAWFTNSLACARGDVLRGVATLGGSRTNSDCTGPVAVMQWHNPDDTLADYSGAVSTRDWYLEQNKCSTIFETVEPLWGNCVKYQSCTDFAPVIFCPHNIDTDYYGNYYPHTWPKDTGAEMMKFFKLLKKE